MLQNSRISSKLEEIENEQSTPGKTRTHIPYNETPSFMYDFLTRLAAYGVMMILRSHVKPFCRHLFHLILFHAVFYVTLKLSQWEKLVVERIRHVILPSVLSFFSLVDRQMFGNGRVGVWVTRALPERFTCHAHSAPVVDFWTSGWWRGHNVHLETFPSSHMDRQKHFMHAFAKYTRSTANSQSRIHTHRA